MNDTGKLRVFGTGYGYKALGQLDELVEVAHVDMHCIPEPLEELVDVAGAIDLLYRDILGAEVDQHKVLLLAELSCKCIPHDHTPGLHRGRHS